MSESPVLLATRLPVKYPHFRLACDTPRTPDVIFVLQWILETLTLYILAVALQYRGGQSSIRQ